MIGKVHYSTIFDALSEYVQQDGKLAEMLAANGVRTSSAAEMAADFEWQRSERPGLRQAVEHVALAWPPSETEKLTNEVMTQAALRYMELRGIDPAQTQWVLMRHNDQDHPHAHLLLNRVDNQGEVVSDKHSQLNSAAACRQVEGEMGFVDAAKLGAAQDLAAAEQAQPAAANLTRLRLKDHLTQALERHLPTATTLPQLQQALATDGIELREVLREGKAVGVVFTAEAYPDLVMKGSEVARRYSLGELTKVLETQAKQALATEQAQQREIERAAAAQQAEALVQTQLRDTLLAALARQLPGATSLEELHTSLGRYEGVTSKPSWQADGQLVGISFAAEAFPGRELSGAALGPAFEPAALTQLLATQAAQRAEELRAAEELRQRLREQTQQLADLTREARWAEAKGAYGLVAEIQHGALPAVTKQLEAYQQQAQETAAGRTMLGEETQRVEEHATQRQQLQLEGQQALRQTLEAGWASWRSWEDYQARVRELGFDLPHHEGKPVELRHLKSGETFALAPVQPGAADGPELRSQVQQELYEQEKVRMGAEVQLEAALKTRFYASEQEVYAQLRPLGYALEITPAGEQQLRHEPSGRQVALAELAPYGQPAATQVPAAAASQQAALRRGCLEVAAGPAATATERTEALGRQLTAAGAQVESVGLPAADGRVELLYRYAWQGPQADPVNQALRQVQAEAGIVVREQNKGFHQPAAEWPRRTGESGQVLLILFDSKERAAADRVAAATRLLEEKGAQVGPPQVEPAGYVQLLVSYQTQHPDFAGLSQRLDHWKGQENMKVIETDYGRAVRAEVRPAAVAAAADLSREVARPERSAEPAPSKEWEMGD